MIFRINQSAGVPLYIQLMEQVKHAVELGALREGDQLPAIRKVAEDLVINPNTVVRAYRELEHEGVLELKHGSGAYIRSTAAKRAPLIEKAQAIVESAIDRLTALGLTVEELRRVFESRLAQLRAEGREEAGRVRR